MAPATPIGHDDQLELLRRLRAQVLLFCGPEGVGRRWTARWYAALLNCSGSAPRPCGRCNSCLAFDRGGHPDYREVGPAETTGAGRSNRRPEIRIGQLVQRRGEEVEPLGAWLEQRPQFRRRVGVIDRAETLNPAAANAFLKFLEAPPSYATVILIAPGAQSLLPTVASRTTRVDFAPLDTSAYADLAPHPGLRMGLIGPLEAARQRADEHQALQHLVGDYAAALRLDLERALEAADGLEKAWGADGGVVADLLREHLAGPRGLAPRLHAAIDACEEAFTSYAHGPLAVQRLTLDLRSALAVPG
jgi:hypothetical protein